MNAGSAPAAPVQDAGGVFVIFLFFMIFAVAIGFAIWTQLPYWRCLSKMNETGTVDDNCDRIIKIHQREEAIQMAEREDRVGLGFGRGTVNINL